MEARAGQDVIVLITNVASLPIKLKSLRVKQDTEGSRHRAEQGGEGEAKHEEGRVG